MNGPALSLLHRVAFALVVEACIWTLSLWRWTWESVADLGYVLAAVYLWVQRARHAGLWVTRPRLGVLPQMRMGIQRRGHLHGADALSADAGAVGAGESASSARVR